MAFATTQSWSLLRKGIGCPSQRATSLINLIASGFIIVGTPYMVTEVLGLSNQLMGVAEGALALGGLVGGVAVSVKPHLFPIQRVPLFLLGATLGFVPIACTMALAPSPLVSYGVILVSFFLTMAMSSTVSIIAVSFLQIKTPPELIGKVIALLMSASTCALPLGQLLFGFGFDNLPMPVLALAVAVTMLGISLAGRAAYRAEFGRPAARAERAARGGAAREETDAACG